MALMPSHVAKQKLMMIKGRAEYLYVNEDSSVEAYLNLGGPDDGPNAAKVGWRK